MVARHVGKHRAQAFLQDRLASAQRDGVPLDEALADQLDAVELERLRPPFAGAAPDMVDFVVRRAQAARAREPEVWP
jgi:hypothetical protein